MKKIVINSCYGGFALSPAAYKEMGLERDGYQFELGRDNPKLVACVEKLGDAANGKFAKLSIVEIPNDAEWHIEEYRGYEHVVQLNRTSY